MITFVTSNPHKAAEIAKMIVGTEIRAAALDIPEIQSFNLEEIVREKASYAQQKIGGGVLVDDVAFDLDVLGGFPGPFVKFWHAEVGYDLVADLVEKTGKDKAVVRSGFGYADGSRFIYTESRVSGRFVASSGADGFGFDFYFIPDGETQTFSKMGADRKNEISHRRRGLDAMRARLEQEGII